MKRLRLWLPALAAYSLVACSGSAITPTATPTPGSMTAPTTGTHMVHQAEHGGQLGMSETLHIEIVSEQPGEYKVYLSDPSGNALSTEGITLEVAVIDTAGNELLTLTATPADSGEYFVASGGRTAITQTDVRVKVWLSENTEPVEMDFTLG